MTIPPKKKELLDGAQKQVSEIQKQYNNGVITDGERYNKVVDIWAEVQDEIGSAVLGGLATQVFHGKDKNGKAKEEIGASFNPIFIMADSGARGSEQQIRQLAGLRGLMAKPSGEIIETPITANFREGLTVLQYFISTHGARKGLADTALKTANSGYLTRRLVDVAQDSIITESDCGTLDGIEMTPLVEGGEVIEGLGDRVLGRVALEEIRDPFTNEVLVGANDMIDEDLVARIEEAGLERVKIRSVLTCQSRQGVCVKCYGRDLGRGHQVNMGEAIGIMAAQSIGEPGTQLTMRTFHIGGTASRRAEQTTLEARNEGIVRLHNVKTVPSKDGSLIVMTRHGEVAIVAPVQAEGAAPNAPARERERERYPLVYGAKLRKSEGAKVKSGELIAEWDPYTTPIITEVAGKIKFGDILEGKTMEERVDERTGARSNVIVESKELDVRPRISIKDDSGKTVRIAATVTEGRPAGTDQYARYFLPVSSYINVAEGAHVDAGEVIAKIPRETTKTKDITGGLPRVAELFEARKPKEFAVISEIDGQVSFGKDTKGKRKVEVTPGNRRKARVPDRQGQAHLGARGRYRQGRRAADGRLVESARYPDHPRRKGAGEVPGRRNPGDLSPAGRAHQRQAYRSDRASDAAARADQGGRRHRFPGRRSDREVAFRRGERARADQGRRARYRGAVAARHHQGVALDRELHLGGVVPGDHSSADRGRHQRQGRSAGRAQGKRHHGPADSGRYRIASVQPQGNQSRRHSDRRRIGEGRAG